MARILIVEDSADNMKLFSAVLGLSGHVVTGLPDGSGFIPRVEAWKPELILMDIQLPGCDGYTLFAELRDCGYVDIPVIALTAHAMTGDEERAMEAGFDGYITKPIDVRSFPDQVSKVLQGKAGTEIA